MASFTRRGFIASTAAAASAAGLKAGPALAQANYPERPIKMIVPWGAGGGTDATARIIGALLEKELGQPVNVVNRTGGSGVVGHAAIATAAPDGYTIGLITVEIAMMHWQGLTELTPRVVHADRRSSTRIRPASRCAPTRRTRRSRTLVAAIKAQPGQVQGVGHRAGRHLASGASPACCKRPEDRSGRACRGCRRTAPRPGCRTSSPAASRSCRARCPRRAR